MPSVSVRYDSAIGGTVTNGTSLIAPGDWSTGGCANEGGGIQGDWNTGGHTNEGGWEQGDCGGGGGHIFE